MSKSKKNTIDPEDIIKNYGADAARLFILSDSPPEKDVQWSEEGIAASYKFIQKLWNLNLNIHKEIKKNHQNDCSEDLSKFTNKFIKKMEYNLSNFNYNIIVANLHEGYSFLIKEIVNSYKKETIIENYEKILITMIPVIPHFANEALEMLKKSDKNIEWPKFDEKFLEEDFSTIVVQINGKKRGILKLKKNIEEENLYRIITKDEKLNKYLIDKKVKRKIFIKNKLINIII